MIKDVIIPMIVALVGSLIITGIIVSCSEVKAEGPEFKVFSVCLEGRKFAVAVTFYGSRTNNISITPFVSNHIINGSGTIQEACK